MNSDSPRCDLTLHALGVVLAALGGCTPDFDHRYTTAKLEIETDFSDPLCEGDLDRWDALVEDIEGQLAIELKPGLAVYLWDEFDWPNGRWCIEGAVGCYVASSHIIYTTFGALEHELVHGVAEGLGSKQALFDEGVAEALQTESTYFGVTAPVSNLDLSSDEVDRVSAGHFVRWLWESYDPQLLRELLASKGDDKSFKSIFGLSLASAQELYFAEAPWSYPPLFVHEVPSLPLVEARRWEEEVELDCGRADTYGRPGGLAVVRTLLIEERGMYALWTNADGVSISQRQREVIANADDARQQASGDVPASMLSWAAGDTINVFDLAPAQYELWITDLGRDLELAEISVWSHLGPIPVTPEVGP